MALATPELRPASSDRLKMLGQTTSGGPANAADATVLDAAGSRPATSLCDQTPGLAMDARRFD